jgi:hypothetical protein
VPDDAVRNRSSRMCAKDLNNGHWNKPMKETVASALPDFRTGKRG